MDLDPALAHWFVGLPNLIEAYHSLLDFSQPVIDRLAEIVAQDEPELGAVETVLLEGFSVLFDSMPALPALWGAVVSSPDWHKVVACGPISTIDRTAAVVPVLSVLLNSPYERVRRLAGMNLQQVNCRENAR